MAPSQGERPDSSVDGDAPAKPKPAVADGGSLTAAALAKHTEALARAQAEAYAATFASARTNYAKSIGKLSGGGRSVAGRSIAGMSIAGRSIAGRSIAGKSIAVTAASVAPSERTFRTHMTTREMLVGPSQMREIMRSVSPISEPGVKIKRRRKRLIDASPCSIDSEAERKRRKKLKKERKAKRLSLHPRRSPAGSPSHYAAPSPTPFQPGTSVAPSAAPSHWTMKDPSVPPELVKKPKKGKDGKTKEAKTGKGKDGKKKGKKKPEVAPSESAEPEPKPKARKAKRSRSPKRKKNS